VTPEHFHAALTAERTLAKYALLAEAATRTIADHPKPVPKEEPL
jgi:hypothetical protein